MVGGGRGQGGGHLRGEGVVEGGSRYRGGGQEEDGQLGTVGLGEGQGGI